MALGVRMFLHAGCVCARAQACARANRHAHVCILVGAVGVPWPCVPLGMFAHGAEHQCCVDSAVFHEHVNGMS